MFDLWWLNDQRILVYPYIFFQARRYQESLSKYFGPGTCFILAFSFWRSLLCISGFCSQSFSRWTFIEGSTVELRFSHPAIITSGIFFFSPFSEPVTTVLFLLHLSILVSPNEEPIPLLFDLLLLPGNKYMNLLTLFPYPFVGCIDIDIWLVWSQCCTPRVPLKPLLYLLKVCSPL